MKLKRVCMVPMLLLSLASGSARLLAQEVFQTTEILAKDRPEAWAMKLVGSELMLTPMGVARSARPWSLELGVDSGWIPSLNAEQRLIGFNGTKEEKVNRTPVFAQPLIMIGLPKRFSLDVSYLPPVNISGIRPNLFAWSLNRPLVSHSWWRLGGGVHGQIGHLRGDITCDAGTVSAGDDPIRNPFGCEAPSKDTMRIRAVGLELGSAFAVSQHLEPFLAAGWNYFNNEFQVNARYSGLIDRTLLRTSGPTFSLRTGMVYRLSRKIRISGEAFYTPLKVRRRGVLMTDSLFNVRASASYLIRE